MADLADPTAALLKALSHPGRLLILCHLAAGEKAVHELEALTGQRQAAVIQQLARLRMEGLVRARRSGKTILYSLGDPRVGRLLASLPRLFDTAAGSPAGTARPRPRPPSRARYRACPAP